MPWVRIDDGFPQHPKVVQVGLNGFALQIAGICYCNRYLTDGFVPNEVLNGLLTGCATDIVQDAVQKLTTVGMWIEEDGGYIIHDYLDYQPSREQVEATQARNRLAGQRSAERRVARSVQRDVEPSVERFVNPSQEHPNRDKETVSKDTSKKVDDAFILSMVGLYEGRWSDAEVREQIIEAMNHKASDKRKDKQLYVKGWLRRNAQGGNNGRFAGNLRTNEDNTPGAATRRMVAQQEAIDRGLPGG